MRKNYLVKIYTVDRQAYFYTVKQVYNKDEAYKRATVAFKIEVGKVYTNVEVREIMR